MRRYAWSIPAHPLPVGVNRADKFFSGCARANLAETLSATGYADLEALDRAAPKEQTKYLEAHGFKFPTLIKSAEDEHGQLGFYANVDGPLRTTCRIAQHFVCERAANVSDPTFKAVGRELRWQKPLMQCSKTMNSLFSKF